MAMDSHEFITQGWVIKFSFMYAIVISTAHKTRNKQSIIQQFAPLKGENRNSHNVQQAENI